MKNRPVMIMGIACVLAFGALAGRPAKAADRKACEGPVPGPGPKSTNDSTRSSLSPRDSTETLDPFLETAPPPSLATHVAVFNMSNEKTSWRALFFSGHTARAKSLLTDLKKAVDGEIRAKAAWERRTQWLATITDEVEACTATASMEYAGRERVAKAAFESALRQPISPPTPPATPEPTPNAVATAAAAYMETMRALGGHRKDELDRLDGWREEQAKTANDWWAEEDARPEIGGNLVTQAFASIKEEKATESRFVGEDGDIVAIFVFYGGSRGSIPNIEPKETKRSSAIQKDFGTLAKLLLDGKLPVPSSQALKEPSPRTIFIAADQYILTKKRATLTLTATPPSGKAAASTGLLDSSFDADAGLDKDSLGYLAAAITKAAVTTAGKAPATEAPGAARAAGDSAKASEAVFSVITGPREHWFLSANVNIRKFDELSFDEDSKTFVPSAKTPRFLLGLNYFFGDLASEKSNGLFMSLLFEPSRKPTGSVGAGLGLRLRKMKASFLEVDGLSPYVGYVHVSGESVEGKPAPPSEWRFVFGLTFNLDKVGDWLKK